jgi:two-component system, NtrC family, response regulator HydG
MEPGPTILVIDDDKDVLYTARLVLRGLFRVDVLENPELIPQYLKKTRYDVILLDMNFSRGNNSGREGLEWLGKIFLINPDSTVLMTTAYGEINLAVDAMKKGAVDFIVKPWNKQQLVSSVSNALDLSRAGKEKDSRKSAGKNTGSDKKDGKIISRSAEMKALLDMAAVVSPTDASILIMGENGTGKELLARKIHNESPRKDGPFIHVDLGAIPETLFEAELFGHTRGAFTGASEERAGRFEAASGGTLFLDEIGNLTFPLQAKLLTAIQSREVVRLGSNRVLKTDVRIISATNMPLYHMAETFQFRQDLLYRINTVEMVIPPLRDRTDDIRPLAEHYLRFFGKQYAKERITISEETFEGLTEYHWPGNIRELAHSIERAVILNKTGFIRYADLGLKPGHRPPGQKADNLTSVRDFEKVAIEKALSKYNGNLSKAADELGIARSTLYRKIAHFEQGE